MRERLVAAIEELTDALCAADSDDERLEALRSVLDCPFCVRCGAWRPQSKGGTFGECPCRNTSL